MDESADREGLGEDLTDGSVASDAPLEPAPPIESRFLFVDIAALRAKQLRRGARVRLQGDVAVAVPHKAERAAMEEVRRGLVYYKVGPPSAGQADS